MDMSHRHALTSGIGIRDPQHPNAVEPERAGQHKGAIRMRRLNTRRYLGALAVAATAGLVLAGCGGGSGNKSAGGTSPGEGKAECAGLTSYGDLTGKKVHVYTSIVAPEDKAQKDSYKLFTTCTGATVQYEGSKEFEAQLVVRVKSG